MRTYSGLLELVGSEDMDALLVSRLSGQEHIKLAGAVVDAQRRILAQAKTSLLPN